jgi:hypothetical protein
MLSLDANKVDINAQPNFHILSFQTRVRADISGPDAFGAKISGVIEAEFFGTSEADINGLRLRHAFTKLDWKKSSLLIGTNMASHVPRRMFPGNPEFQYRCSVYPFQPQSPDPFYL